MPNLSNNDRLRQIAKALDELNADIVYVGGAVIQLYSTDAAAVNPMTTYDVDCVVDIASYHEFQEFEQKLYAKHFRNDISEGAPICRFLYDGEKVDFMPKVDTEIGKSNSWYRKGVECRQPYKLEDGKIIYIMPVQYFLASKFEALHSRGGNDYRGEKDFEDIVFVVNSCSNLINELQKCADSNVKGFLAKEFLALIERQNIQEEIESSMMEDGRSDSVISVMEAIAFESSLKNIGIV
ncbi:MAG: hypothetical protein J5695_06750 [Bacteroidales bacterium]|nr:hypothetical protein [Bacteroidales bacterium]